MITNVLSSIADLTIDHWSAQEVEQISELRFMYNNVESDYGLHFVQEWWHDDLLNPQSIHLNKPTPIFK